MIETDELLSRLARVYTDKGSASDDTTPGVLTDLFHGLSPAEAAVMAQILLKDLRPILYPPPTTSTTINLRDYNFNSYHEIILEEAFLLWHPEALRVYRVNADVERVLTILDDIPRGKWYLADPISVIVYNLLQEECGVDHALIIFNILLHRLEFVSL